MLGRVEQSHRIHLFAGNILDLDVDVIVNAANQSLLGGGGVDGVIHRAAGPKLLEACRALGGCEVGDAKLTPAFDLPANYIIHAVGPIWKDREERVQALLANCYAKAIDLAAAHDCRSIAFPAISTGTFGFPKNIAAEIALATVRSGLENHPDITVYLVSFPLREKKHLRAAAKSLGITCSQKS